MSTRCQIVIKDGESFNPIKIYKHSDGYPNGVLPTLEPFIKDFVVNRGPDVEYCLAQIVRHFAVKDFVRNDKKEVPSSSRYIGWGLDTELHGDIEFLYIVDLSQGGNVETISGSKLIEIIETQNRKAFRY